MSVNYGRLALNKEEFLECVPEGWRKIAEPLYAVFEENNTTIAQIKEKFGTLRIYVDSATDEVYDQIDAVEEQSRTVCMACGEPGEIRTDKYWLHVSCDSCLEKA